MQIYLDMDGVLCDFIGGVGRLFKQNPLEFARKQATQGLYEAAGVPPAALWSKIEQAGANWWRNLDKSAIADDLVDISLAETNGDVFIVTSVPNFKDQSVLGGVHQGKIDWLSANLAVNGDPLFWRRRTLFVSTEHKHLLAREGRLIVDDTDVVTKTWTAAGGMAIQVDLLSPRVGDVIDRVRWAASGIGG